MARKSLKDRFESVFPDVFNTALYYAEHSDPSIAMWRIVSSLHQRDYSKTTTDNNRSLIIDVVERGARRNKSYKDDYEWQVEELRDTTH